MTATIHPFEEAGLGIAPFRFAGMSEKVYVAYPGAPTQAGGTCDFCSTGIRYCCHIVSADKKEFVVGCDCVKRLNSADNKLISDVERAMAKVEKEKRDAKRKAKWEKVCQDREARIQAERDANGGFTLAELRQQEEAKAREAKRNEMLAVNGWVLKVLEAVPYASEFVDSMIQQLEQKPLKDLSERCREIIGEIYAKQAGRRGSKAYEAAIAEYETKAGA